MIALVTIARNEAHRMLEHLTLASAYCDELVVVDQDSDDGTADAISDFGATLVHDECRGFSEASRTLAFANVQADWVMYLDADEHLDPARIPGLSAIQAEYDAAHVAVYSYIDGVLLNPLVSGHVYQNRQVRFFHKDRVTWGNEIHQRIYPTTPRVFHSLRPEQPWVLNVKAGWEQELDDARYRAVDSAYKPVMA